MNIIKATNIVKDVEIAIVVSRFNEQVTQGLFNGGLERLEELSFPSENITYVEVPGAVEIPLAAKRLASSGKFAAIVCMGAVIRGETGHYDFICKQVSDGCQAVMLEFDLPVIFSVLTTDNLEQALDRIGGEHGHKGREAIDAAFEMISIMRQIARDQI